MRGVLTDGLLLTLALTLIDAVPDHALYSSIDGKNEVYEHVLIKRESPLVTNPPLQRRSTLLSTFTSNPPTPTSSAVSNPPTPTSSAVLNPPTPTSSAVSSPPTPTSSAVSSPPTPTSSAVSSSTTITTTTRRITHDFFTSSTRETTVPAVATTPSSMSEPSTSVSSSISSLTTSRSHQSLTTNETSTSPSSLPTSIANNSVSTTISPSINVTDDHEYYKATYYTDNLKKYQEYWVELDATNSETSPLSNSHRTAQEVEFPWNFYFYGSLTNRTIITTGGFMSTGSIHSAFTHSQYIAPLMADFNPTIGNTSSEIFYRFTADEAIVQWTGVTLNNLQDAGPYTFQTRIKRASGDIIFIYKMIPQPVSAIPRSGQHPVKLGISDGFLFFSWTQLATIFYQYHDLNLEASRISNNTVVILKHSKLCNMMTSCNDCLSSELADFECLWCNALQRCSSGLDRDYIQWRNSACHTTEVTHCSIKEPTPLPDQQTTNPMISKHSTPVIRYQANHSGLVAGLAIGLFLLVILSAAIAVIVYGYRYPTSPVGRFIIENRPRRLMQRWKQGRSTESTDRYRINLSELSDA